MPGLCAAALLVGLTLAGEAAAQPKGPEADAKAQFEAGQAAVEKGDLKGGRALFLSSKQLFATAGTLLNLADCEEKLGLVASAWQHFRDAVPMLRKGDGRIAFANERAAALLPRLPRLRIDVAAAAPAGTRVLLDAREVAASSLGTEMPLDPGAHVVTVTAPGRAEASFSVTLAEKQQQTVVVEPGAAEAGASSGPGAPVSGFVGSARNVGIGIGVTGLVAVAIGAITGGLAVQTKGELEKQCPDPARCTAKGVQTAQDGKVLGTIASIGLGMGIPLTAIGAILVAASPKRPPLEVQAFVTAATAGAAGGVSVVVSGAF